MLANIEIGFNDLLQRKETRFSNSDYNKTISLVHSTIVELDKLKKHKTNDELRSDFSFIREVHSKSKFIKRLQEWPLGYQGDYQTIEQLCTLDNTSVEYGIDYYLENYALNCFVAQQHRNKIQIQSNRILQAVISESKKKSNILICACGSSFDVRSIQHIIEKFDCNIILNDLDNNALNYSESKLSAKMNKKVVYDNRNIISTIRDLKNQSEKFDLILFGGLFDYLSDKQITFVLRNSYEHLTSRGRILFTNICKNNPFKSWIEVCGNWELIERDDQLNIEMCRQASIPSVKIIQYRDSTNLTNIVEVCNWL